jgi:hypothetical protein
MNNTPRQSSKAGGAFVFWIVFSWLQQASEKGVVAVKLP